MADPISDDEFLSLFGEPPDEADEFFPPGVIGKEPVPERPDERERWTTVDDPVLQRKLDDDQANSLAELDVYYREYERDLEAFLRQELRERGTPEGK